MWLALFQPYGQPDAKGQSQVTWKSQRNGPGRHFASSYSTRAGDFANDIALGNPQGQTVVLVTTSNHESLASKALRDNQPILVTSDPETVAVKDHIEIPVPYSDVFYHEQNNILGICVKIVDEPMTPWTPIKISRSRMRVADSNSSDDDISVDDCLMLDYQVVNGAPGFEAEMKDDTFWMPISHHTHSAACVCLVN